MFSFFNTDGITPVGSVTDSNTAFISGTGTISDSQSVFVFGTSGTSASFAADSQFCYVGSTNTYPDPEGTGDPDDPGGSTPPPVTTFDPAAARSIAARNSIRRYGKNDIKIENRFIQTSVRAEEIIDSLVNEYSVARDIIELTCLGDWTAQLWDTVTVSSLDQFGIDTPITFQVIKIQYEYDGGLKTTYTLRRAR